MIFDRAVFVSNDVEKMKRPDVGYGKKLTIYYEGSKLFRSTKDVEVVLNASMPKE